MMQNLLQKPSGKGVSCSRRVHNLQVCSSLVQKHEGRGRWVAFTLWDVFGSLFILGHRAVLLFIYGERAGFARGYHDALDTLVEEAPAHPGSDPALQIPDLREGAFDLVDFRLGRRLALEQAERLHRIHHEVVQMGIERLQPLPSLMGVKLRAQRHSDACTRSIHLSLSRSNFPTARGGSRHRDPPCGTRQRRLGSSRRPGRADLRAPGSCQRLPPAMSQVQTAPRQRPSADSSQSGPANPSPPASAAAPAGQFVSGFLGGTAHKSLPGSSSDRPPPPRALPCSARIRPRLKRGKVRAPGGCPPILAPHGQSLVAEPDDEVDEGVAHEGESRALPCEDEVASAAELRLGPAGSTDLLGGTARDVAPERDSVAVGEQSPTAHPRQGATGSGRRRREGVAGKLRLRSMQP
eukprot:scaffold334_cov241-Pinguiococcus_pyrenoidosus.AAC.42